MTGLLQVANRRPLPRRDRAHPLRRRRKVAIDQAVNCRGRHVGVGISAVGLDLLGPQQLPVQLCDEPFPIRFVGRRQGGMQARKARLPFACVADFGAVSRTIDISVSLPS